jgi:ribose 5-phosphate isomerase B
MTIAIGTDHAGYDLAQTITKLLTENGYTCVDLGCDGNACHYPAFSAAVCKEVMNKNADFGLLFCGTGVGMMMSANKRSGIRAMLACDSFSVKMSRAHNNANILCLGGRVLSVEKAWELTRLFLCTSFEGGRHKERIEMYDKIL